MTVVAHRGWIEFGHEGDSRGPGAAAAGVEDGLEGACDGGNVGISAVSGEGGGGALKWKRRRKGECC